MFHIKSDIRSKKSAHLIYQALLKLVATKSFEEITISDISRVSTVSRATFYRHFDDITDVFAWQNDLQLHEILTSYVQLNHNKSIPDDLLSYLLENLLKENNLQSWKILLDIGRQDIIYTTFLNNAPILLDYFQSLGIYQEESLTEYTYFISIRVGFLIGILNGWFRAGQKQTAEEVTSIVMKQHQEIIKSGKIF